MEFSNERLTVAFFPNSYRDNPYLNLLEMHLNQLNIVVYPAEYNRPFISWLRQNRGKIQILHFHWLSNIYKCPMLLESFKRLLKFALQLFYAKFLGYRIVWTAHNLYPHERDYPLLDHLCRLLIVRLSDSIIVHCEQAKKFLIDKFKRKDNVLVGYLPSYANIYLENITRNQARKHLEIQENAFLFLFFGGIRSYKGLDDLLKTFSNLEKTNINLLIAGKAFEFYDLDEEILTILEKDQRIRSFLTWIPDDEVQYYFKAADVFVSPFTKILTSSSVMLALSFGCPVIAPAIGCMPELINEKTGILYDPRDPNGLKNALLESLTLSLPEMRQNCLQYSRKYQWDDFANIVKEAYYL